MGGCLSLRGADSSGWSLVFSLVHPMMTILPALVKHNSCPTLEALPVLLGEEAEHLEISLTLVLAVPRSEK